MKETAQVFIPLIRFPLHSFFFHLYLFDAVSFQDAQVFVGFLFSKGSNLVLIWQFNSVHQVSFHYMPLFITNMAHFSMPNSIPMS